jgi:phenylacetate-CoA ligase
MYTALAERIIYPLGDMFFNTRIMRYLHELDDTQWWSPSQLQDLQTRKLHNLVQHAYANVPFYRLRFDQQKLKPEDIRSAEDLPKLPLLTKREIKDNFPDKLTARNIAEKDMLPGLTGGSTGRPLQFYRFRDSTSRDWAAALRAWSWAGYRPGHKYATLWGSPLTLEKQSELPGRLRNLLMRNLLLSAYEMDESSLRRYAEQLERYEPRFIRGYASAVFLLAQTLQQQGIGSLSPQAVFTTSEMLFCYQRELIEEQLRCKVFDHYGSGEVHSVAHECEQHCGYHITAENMIVEFINEDGSTCQAGEQGELVITDLNNYATPLLRYNIEDVGVPEDRPCACGRGLPLIRSLQGRSSEILRLPNGRLVPLGYWVVLFETVSGVEQYQVVQNTLNRLTVKIIKNPSFTQGDLTHIATNLRRLGGEELDYEIQMVDAIPVSASGKRRFVITEVEGMQDTAAPGGAV